MVYVLSRYSRRYIVLLLCDVMGFSPRSQATFNAPQLCLLKMALLTWIREEIMKNKPAFTVIICQTTYISVCMTLPKAKGRRMETSRATERTEATVTKQESFLESFRAFC